MKKTNAMRILDGLGISYETAEYEDDGEHELAKGAALRLSEKLGVAPETVFKTIVMRTETKEICVFCQSAESEINLKKARQAAGCKEINPVRPEELLALTGYIRGGCCPIGMRRPFPSYIDETCLLHEKIYVSAGQRGMQIRLTPQDLINYVPLEVNDLI